ncbi:phosphoadenosine phosphosulfate reductase family protein [Pseudomonas sp.]|jgi:3'-phosphoadenosine 5'-phosphosulfate sulfotransferase (PAPS reductase)/FAD synthetase|uniref:phosphoadenosine phosphosulfate reductase family protein n=1 Tax=Pseudomonas sp. TaxID=306 RepID=UPI002ED90F24
MNTLYGMDSTDTNVFSISGGKDSTAMLLLGIERQVPNVQAVFCDTGNEHPQTYDYVRYLADATGVEIRWIKAEFATKMANKRTYLQKHWGAQLMAGRPLAPGHWYRNDLQGCDSEADFPTAQREPLNVPANMFEPATVGVWSWFPAQREIAPLVAERAQELMDAACEMLQPTGIPFLDMCLWKGLFPSTKRRFCTQELKILPIQEQIFAPLLADHRTQDVYSWQGVRADESLARSKLPEIDEVGNGLFNYRPILAWTVEDVFAMHRKHGIKPNPLYLQGMSRVGCMPCVSNRKEELAEIAVRFPEEVARIRRWESMVSTASKRGSSTFFTSITDPTVRSNDRITHLSHGIDRMIEWSMTSRGGRQFDLIRAVADGVSCSSAYGLCE